MGFFKDVRENAKLANEAKKEGKPFIIGNGTVDVVEPVDIDEAIEYMGLPPGTSLQSDDATYEMWLPKTGLKQTDFGNYYLGTLKNEGNRAAFYIDRKRIGYLSDDALPEAVEALRDHGGKQAPAALKVTKEGSRTDIVQVGKVGWHWEKKVKTKVPVT